jgi:ABC-type antimicrobial peptide transport system permease subunit
VPHSILATTKDPHAQLAFGDHLYDTLSKVQVAVFSFNNLVRTLRHSLASMYLIMHLVTGTVIFVVALMAGMLSNIYFTQRISEFATLAAIGLRRSILVWHAVSETAILTSLGWVVGLIVNWTALSLMQGRVFEPRGMLINPSDPNSLVNTLPIPIMITLFAVATISYRLSHLDPVSIIERR